MMHWFGEYGYGMGHGFGWIFMLLFWIVIIAGIVFLIRSFQKKDEGGESKPRAEEILKQRYARGEIDKEEYERIREDIRK